MRVRVRVDGVKKAQANIERYTEQKKAELKDIVNESALNIQREARKRCPVDTGRLRASITPKFDADGLAAEIGTNVKYAPYVEFGTNPHFPPPQALSGWARRHGSAGFEFAIARAIAQKGTPAQPFLFPSYEEERPKFKAKVEAVMKKK